MIPASDIDRLLLSFNDAHWRKVARIIGQTYKALEERDIAISGGIAKLMDARMAILVRSGKLEAKGNIKRWGYSEVRLPAEFKLKPVTCPPRHAERRRMARGGAQPRKKKRVEAAEW